MVSSFWGFGYSARRLKDRVCLSVSVSLSLSLSLFVHVCNAHAFCVRMCVRVSLGRIDDGHVLVPRCLPMQAERAMESATQNGLGWDGLHRDLS